MVSQLDSFWCWGKREIGNDVFQKLVFGVDTVQPTSQNEIQIVQTKIVPQEQMKLN